MGKPDLSRAPEWATHLVEWVNDEELDWEGWWFVNPSLDSWSFQNGYEIFPTRLGAHLKGVGYKWTELNVDLENK